MNNPMKTAVLFLLLFIMRNKADITITGNVYNCCDIPLEGMTVTHPTTGKTCITGADGEFTLSTSIVHNQRTITQPVQIKTFTLYGLKGKKVAYGKYRDLRHCLKRLSGNCYILHITGSDGNGFSRILILPEISYTSFFSSATKRNGLSKKTSTVDSVIISGGEYTPRTVSFSGKTVLLESIRLTRSSDPFEDCNVLAEALQVTKQNCEAIMKDSLFSETAGYEWSCSNLEITPLENTGGRRVLTVSPWGFYTAYTLQIDYPSYSQRYCGYAGLTGFSLLDPVFTKTGHIQNLVVMRGSYIDENSYVVLWGGTPLDSAKNFLPDVHRKIDYIPPPYPFDTTYVRSYFLALKKEHYGYFSDSSGLNSDTVTLVTETDSGGVFSEYTSATLTGKHTDQEMYVRKHLTINADAHLTRCRIMAESIHIKGGFSQNCIFYSQSTMRIDDGNHNSQIFSADTMHVGGTVETSPSTLWMAVCASDHYGSGIFFARNDLIQGTAIATRQPGEISLRPVIHIDSGSTFKGYIITEGDLNTKFCTIIGSVYCGEIKTSFENWNYSGYMIGVNLLKPDTELCLPLLGDNPLDLYLHGEQILRECF